MIGAVCRGDVAQNCARLLDVGGEGRSLLTSVALNTEGETYGRADVGLSYLHDDRDLRRGLGWLCGTGHPCGDSGGPPAESLVGCSGHARSGEETVQTLNARAFHKEAPTRLRIFLVGFMGSGKSTVGRALAQRLDWAFVDLDREIERRWSMDIPTVFSQCGEEEFRRRESEMLKQVSTRPRVVVATGGGTFVDAENMSLIARSGVSVWIDPGTELILQRLRRSVRKRPLYRDQEQARRLWEERRPAYAQAALRIVVSPGDQAITIADRIIAKLKESPCAT